MNKWQRIMYNPNLPLGKDGHRVTESTEHIELSRQAAKEGMVLVKNTEGLLPLAKGSKVALFGKGTFDYVKGGGGSGDVTVSYTTNLYDGMKRLDHLVEVYEPLAEYYKAHVASEYKAGHEPGLTDEPAVGEALLNGAKAFADTAIISICRFSGEGWDRKSTLDVDAVYAEKWVERYAERANSLFKDGDFYLSENEAKMVAAVKETFDKVVVVMNVGGMVASKWFEEDQAIQSVLMAWQGGMEGGNAAAELLMGLTCPSGKLTDTFAERLEDYPSTYNYHESKDYVEYTDDIYVGYRYFETIPGAGDKVVYPFGYGLSYTQFDWAVVATTISQGQLTTTLEVTNIGQMPGREVFQLYVMAPQGLLGKPAKSLLAFKKTRSLAVGESQKITMTVSQEMLASYDDTGKVKKSAYVIEKGSYAFFLGTSIRHGQVLDGQWTFDDNQVVEQLAEKLKPTSLGKKMLADGTYEDLSQSQGNDPDATALDHQSPDQLDGYGPQTRQRDRYLLHPAVHNKQLLDVYEGRVTMEEFIKDLKDEDLIHLLGGQPNTCVANTFGFGNLPEYGIPNIMTADGPAGLRINKECGVNTTAWPCSTLLACTWDDAIIYQVGAAGAREVKENNLAVWLTPAVNIHRSPLCGRNFEYYSEDPLVAGKLAAAMVKGIQSEGISSAVKHFALNNKEANRKNCDSRVTERAAREIYLKAFEIIVKEASPWCIMSSYNIINGHRASENRQLLEDILRDEWGFGGAVTTDWWTYGEHYKEVNAGNDIKMACGHPERLARALDLGVLTRETLEVSAKRVLQLIMNVG